MNFVSVNEKLANEENNLSVLQLKILQPLRDTYDALLVQPLGAMQANEQYIRHEDQDAAIKLYQDLLNKACDHAVDLVVTPEYCIPWSVIEKIAETDLKPKHKSLWALGCESITLDVLEDFKERWTQEGIKVLYETPSQQNKYFLCPLVYIFWVNNDNEKPNICMLIQFKTVPSGGAFENDNLYCGNDVYIFGDGINELNYFSLICADVFEITPEQIQKHHKDSLISHIQLNEKPWHKDFVGYRNRLFSVGSNNKVELMCLNWATGITWDYGGGHENITTWDNSPNSAFYIPKILFKKIQDTELDVIHKNGIYYNRINSQWDSLFLNNTAQAILLRKQPIRFDGEQVLALPWRLKCLKRFVPNNDNNSWVEANEVDDGFKELLDEYSPIDPEFQDIFDRFKNNLMAIHDASPLAVERSLELLQGPEGRSSSWYYLEELHALEVGSNESPRRVTTCQEKCITRDGVVFRKRRVQASYEAAILHTENVNWPIPLRDIGEGFSYQWREANPHNNVVPLDATDNPATLIYLNSCIPGEAESRYKKMLKVLHDYVIKTCDSNNPEIFIKNVTRAKDRLCVVYKDNLRLKVFHESDGKKSITEPANQSPTDIGAG